MMDGLAKLGWYLSEDNLFNYFGDEIPTNAADINKLLLDCDIREIVNDADRQPTGRAAFANENGQVSTPIILQIQKVRNVAVTKAHENDPSVLSRLLRLALTDGKATGSALEMSRVQGLSQDTPPGTKLQLTGNIRYERGFLLLTPSNCRILGGHVEKLVEKWRLKDGHSLTRRAGATDGQSGPPPWVPFGQKSKQLDGTLSSISKNMRVMDLAASGQQAAPPVSEEFSQSRQNVIAEVMKQQQQSRKPKGNQGPSQK